MCNIEPDTKSWLEEKLITELKISLKKTECIHQYKASLPTDTLFLARIILLDLKFIDEKGKKEDEVCQTLKLELRGLEFKINLVVKRPPTGTMGREIFDFDGTFHNEILFYTKFAKLYQDYPKLFYSYEKPPYDTILVIENITSQGYHLSSKKTNLDIKYILPAVHEIAKFHTNSYVLKDKCSKKFFEIVKSIQSIMPPHTKDSVLVRRSRATVPRILNYLRRENYDAVFCQKLEQFLNDAYTYVTFDLSRPVEPLATLCHGDFTSNNVFFKESDDSIQAKLIDFGMINYGSPCKDLCLFLYLNGNRSYRTDKFQAIFDVYYETLMKGLKEAGLEVNNEKFSKEAFLEDYKKQAFFGYHIASTYMPVIFGYLGENTHTILEMPCETICQILNEVGGDEFTKILVDMILDLIEAGSLDHIINV